MSVDLLIDSVRPISVKPRLPKIAAALTELLDLTSVPTLEMQRLEDRKILPVVADQVGIDNAPFILISIAGEPETVGLVGRADHLTVTIFGPRSSLQYALGAATAIVVAREFRSGLWDDRKVFGGEEYTSAENLLERLRVLGPHDDYRDAADSISWGPGH
jgi:hypothetical protein